MTFDGQQRINLTSSVERGEVSDRFTINLSANTYYPAFIEYDKYTGDSLLQLYWIKPGQSTEEIVPTDNLWFDHYYGGQRIELNLTCPDGYSTGYVQDELFCHETCGDGIRIDDEQWDDSNKNNGDGCNSKCKVEEGYICSGGNAIISDKWVRCPAGYKHYRYFENTDYVECTPETENYNTIFYIIIVILTIGMIKYFIKNLIRAYKQKKTKNSDWQENNNKEESKIAPEEQKNVENEEQNRNEGQNNESENGTQNNAIELGNQSRLGEQQNKVADNKEDINYIEFHR